jgi:hypothetical protein
MSTNSMARLLQMLWQMLPESGIFTAYGGRGANVLCRAGLVSVTLVVGFL